MKVYEYLSDLFTTNNIDFNEIKSIKVVYLTVKDRYNTDSWKVVRKQLDMTDNIPINPMHIEEWDDDISDIFIAAADDGEELAMTIQLKLRNNDMFKTLFCMINPNKTYLIPFKDRLKPDLFIYRHHLK